MTNKEAFTTLLKKRGYNSLHDFCIRNQLDYANMNKRVNGVRQKVEIAWMFRLANMLEVSITDIIEIFYPEDYAENKKHIK